MGKAADVQNCAAAYSARRAPTRGRAALRAATGRRRGGAELRRRSRERGKTRTSRFTRRGQDPQTFF